MAAIVYRSSSEIKKKRRRIWKLENGTPYKKIRHLSAPIIKIKDKIKQFKHDHNESITIIASIWNAGCGIGVVTGWSVKNIVLKFFSVKNIAIYCHKKLLC